MSKPRRSRDNWSKDSSNYSKHMNDKEIVEELKKSIIIKEPKILKK
jgi:hypothetical protein